MSIKSYDQTPVYIVDDHNDALKFILDGIGSMHLRFDDNLLIHFDSHPDLLLNTDIKSEDIFDKETVLEKVSIETWILPLTFAGHVSKIVWVKPEWSNQIEEETYTFYIGENKNKEIKVSSPLLYFISALNYSPFEELINPKKIILHVISFNNSEDSVKKCQCELQKIIKEHDKDYLLDIDLDFFSTLNPFIEMFGEAKMYDRLREIYKFGDGEILEVGADKAQAMRKMHLEHLQEIFKNLETMDNPEDKVNKVDDVIANISDRKIYTVLKDLILDLCKLYGEEVDWDMIHNAGTTIDDPNKELPHHPSGKEEILRYIDNLKTLLKALPAPKIISMARSSLDDYCPPDIVDFIQENVCNVLTELFNPKIEKHYDEGEKVITEG